MALAAQADPLARRDGLEPWLRVTARLVARRLGSPPGMHLVAIRPRNELKSDDEALARTMAKSKQATPWAEAPKQKASIPAKFHAPKTSGLKVVVASNENSPFNFDLPRAVSG